MRALSREVLARDAAWTLADGNCKGLTRRWAAWEAIYLSSEAIADRARALIAPAEVCAGCLITTECANLAELSGYTGIAGGRAYRNGREDTYRMREASTRPRRTG